MFLNPITGQLYKLDLFLNQQTNLSFFNYISNGYWHTN